MKYELLKNATMAVLIDRTPILGDIRDTYTVSFLLPEQGAFIALFSGVDKIEYKKRIEDGVCKIPKELLGKEQYVAVKVCQISEDKLLQTWECEPLKITAFISLRQSQWEISGGMSERDCFNRMIELEKANASFSNDLINLRLEITQNYAVSQEVINISNTQIAVSKENIEILQSQNKDLSNSYNNAILVINDLSKRLNLLEKNYDPTVID